jgi:hypothetical protein
MYQPYLDFDANEQDYNPTAEDRLRDELQSKWEKDQSDVRSQGRWPDWKGEPRPLCKDKARLLYYLYEHGYIQWDGNPSKNNTSVAENIGMTSIPHAKALLNGCLKESLIESRLYRGKQVYQMTQDGEYALGEYEIEQEVAGL